MSHPDWTAGLVTELQTTIGREVRFFPSAGSTNDLLKAAARDGAAEGLVFVTDEQTAGRGRRGRSWSAPAGSSLLVSILLRPAWLPASDAFLLTVLAAVAAAEALATTGVAIDLKWPNDLHINGRKLGGILVEAELRESAIDWCVIGCGINVNWDPRSVPELAATATSLSRESGREHDRRALLAQLLRRVDSWYRQLRRGARSALHESWRGRLTMLGQPVRVDSPTGIIFGIAADVTHDGALIVRESSGVTHTIMAGDVSLRLDTNP
jgi:BirA family transcriptional regulator, biotin operon repressor / biotin---[acetyl-CoA-carboxylase] ligase